MEQSSVFKSVSFCMNSFQQTNSNEKMIFFRRGVVLLDGTTCSEGCEMDESMNRVS